MSFRCALECIYILVGDSLFCFLLDTVNNSLTHCETALHVSGLSWPLVM